MSKYEDLASAVRAAILECCYDRIKNVVDIRSMNYSVLAEKLREYNFIHMVGFDETLGLKISFENLKSHAKKKDLRFLVEDLMLNPELCGFFFKELKKYRWIYKKR